MSTAPPTAGHSGTPLVKKLGIRPGTTLLLVRAPADYISSLQELPGDLVFAKRLSANVDLVQHFTTQRKELAAQLARYREVLRSNAVVWVSWPKKAAKVETDITEDTVREVTLPLGWVDVKVCAVDATWSGLKLVVRKALR